MANVTFTPKDVYGVMNDLYRIVTGQDNIKVIDTSSFVSAGQKVLDTGYQSILDGVSVLVGETFYNERKYVGKWRIAVRDMPGWAERKRKISFYSRNAEPAGFVNTDLYTNFYDGADNTAGVGSMWDDMRIPMAVEEYFYSSAVWDDHITYFEDKLEDAFRSEDEFMKFINSYLIVFTNAMELRAQGKVQSVVLDRIAGIFLQQATRPECAVNLRKVYNDWSNSAYSSDELTHEHLLDFLKTFASKVKIDSDKITNLTKLYHDPMTKTVDGVEYNVLRHTPKDKQRLIYYKPIFDLAKNWNFAELFNPQFIPEIQGEGVDYWMTPSTDVYGDAMKIMVKPALPNGAETSNVEIPQLIGMLFDEDAIATRNVFERAATTPLEARKLYYQTWYHMRFSAYNDYSENAIIYYVADELDTFTGDGTTTAFELNTDAKRIVKVTVGDTEVADTDYTYANGTITFTTAPANDATIKVQYV